jgi:hypothetical protein
VINVIAIGLGIDPIHLPDIFPVALYTPNISEFASGLAAVLGVSSIQSSKSIIPRVFFSFY